MKRILITGANSFVGSSFREYLKGRKADYDITSVSVRDDMWKTMSFSGFDVIYHCAAIVHQPETKNDLSQSSVYKRVNTDLPFALAQKARAEGVRQFVFLSTAAVYGLEASMRTPCVITRDTPLKPADLYGKSKLDAEELLRSLENDSFHVAIVRPPTIYGPGCKGNYNALSAIGRRLPCFPKVSNQHFMIYVDNLSEFVRLLIEDNASGVFCPQNREPISTDDVVSAVSEAHGRKMLLIPGFRWALCLLAVIFPKARKAFGSQYYAAELCSYPTDYQAVPFGESILRTETNR